MPRILNLIYGRVAQGAVAPSSVKADVATPQNQRFHNPSKIVLFDICSLIISESYSKERKSGWLHSFDQGLINKLPFGIPHQL